MLSKYKPSFYEQQTQRKFAQIFYKNQDIIQNSFFSIPQPNPHRQQILFSQYPMQKKGKNFNKVEERIFRIDDGLLKQIDKNGQARDLPFPKSVLRQQMRPNNNNQWGFSQYKYRLLMQFEERSSILVYTKTKEQVTQLYSFICSKIHPQQRDILHAAFERYYRPKLMNRTIKAGNKLKQSKKINIQSKNQKIINKINLDYTQKSISKQLILLWHKKAAMTQDSKQKTTQKVSNNVINLKNVVNQLAFNLDYIRISSQSNYISGQLKLWVNQMTNKQVFKFSQLLANQFQLRNNINNSFNPFQFTKRFNLSGQSFNFKNQTPALTIWTSFQFQVQTFAQNQQNCIWRSQRFFVFDLLKSLKSGPKKTILLWHKQNYIQLVLTFKVAKNQLLKIQIPPQHETFPLSYTYNLKPNHYPILNQLISKPLLRKYIQTQSPETMHLQYTFAFQQYLQTQSTRSLNFCNFSKLYDTLNIDNIIQKFYSTHPYNAYINVKYKGTFVYELLAKKSQKFAYYDAEKFIWKYQCQNLRRFLSVIKAFDEFPRIIFSQPFYFLCINFLKIAQKQSLIRWKSQTFQNTLIGRESLAFFLLLGILRCSTQLLLHQPNKTVLSNNSLLFHYILKKRNRSLYNKYLQIQINIQALFGIMSASLFSQLFVQQSNKNSFIQSSQLYIMILNFLIKQKKQQQILQLQNPHDTTHTIRFNHFISLVAVFLAILHLFDHIVTTKAINKYNNKGNDQVVGNSVAYSTAYSFIQYLKLFVLNHLQLYTLEFSILYHKYYQICQQQLTNPNTQYTILQQNMQKFYSQNQSSVQNSLQNSNPQNSNINNLKIGQLLSKLFSQFMCYRHKNQGDIRKICIVIDNVNLGLYYMPTTAANNTSASYRPSSLIIQLFQANSIIYQHQYVVNAKGQTTGIATKQGIMDQLPTLSLYYENLKHTIQLKLNRLSPIHIVISYIDSTPNSTLTSYSTTLDPKQIPSNYYIQLVKQLNSVNIANINGKLNIENKITDIDSNRYICLQTYIKDSCDVDYLQNAVPNQYINLLVLKDRISSSDNRQKQSHQQNQSYKKDIIFCNQYFTSYRLTQNNFNLLYAKLGWYGNHYLLPADRINHILITNDNQFNKNNNNNNTTNSNTRNGTNSKKQPNNAQIITKILTNSCSEVSVKAMGSVDRVRIFQILFYTRCIYGRGLIPSINYPISQKTSTSPTQIIVQQCRNNKITIRQCKQLKHEINQNQFNSCNNLMGYLYDNFNTIGTGSNLHTYNLVDFYIRAVKELPLIRYLCFRPLQFYLLDQIRFSLKIAQNAKNNDVDVRNYSSNPVHASSSPNITSSPSQYIKNKLLTFSPLLSHKGVSQQTININKIYQIVLTNHPIILNKHNNQAHIQEKPYPFISNPSYFSQQLYKNYSQDTQNAMYIYSNCTKLLYNKLIQGTELPTTMYFTYPQGINYNWSRDGSEVYTNNTQVQYQQTSRQMHVDQFLWLLKMNIIKYYIVDVKIKPNIHIQKDKQKQKKNKNIHQHIPDCMIRIRDPTFPNISIWDLYQLISQTKHKVQLIVTPIVPTILPTLYGQNPSKNQQPRYPIVLNPAYRHYTSYGYINAIWNPVCILARLISPNLQLYYCEEKYSRKFRLMRSSQVIIGIQNKRILDKLPFYKFTDNEILSGKDCVSKELIRIY